MATVAEYIDDLFGEISDKRVSNWFLMSTIWPTIGIIAIYLTLIYGVLPVYMKNRKPYNLTKIIRFYNLIQIASCAWLIYWILTSGWLQGDFSIKCQPIDYSSTPRALALLRAFYWTYFLKLLELVETVFFILRHKAKQVTKLHVYHHASTLTLAWIACKFVGGGMASVPVLLNCFIHILMYSYYYLSSLGPVWQKKLNPWKPRLTIAQMVQFTILIIHALTALKPECKAPRIFIMLYVPNVALIFKMFYDFYRASYTKTQKAIKKVK